jgi:putative GTP pyrophosphokinase
MTKVNILRQELTLTHDYNPIEHVKSRLKSADSILDKARRRGYGTTAEEIRAHVTDIAGVRIVCSFTTDVHEVATMLTSQSDLRLLRTRDYIASPKPNGYRSLHLLVEVPVFLSTAVEPVTVELQLRTVAVDFWASLEHKAVYKYRGQVPPAVQEELQQVAGISSALDARIETLRSDIVRPL